jgi:hypothetical protein
VPGTIGQEESTGFTSRKMPSIRIPNCQRTSPPVELTSPFKNHVVKQKVIPDEQESAAVLMPDRSSLLVIV